MSNLTEQEKLDLVLDLSLAIRRCMVLKPSNAAILAERKACKKLLQALDIDPASENIERALGL